uniref:IgLON family member 5 n=1 Tax=Fundulus heteroclitus TaxID=8078 RepID=A0A3Q2PZY7_FUNHE
MSCLVFLFNRRHGLAKDVFGAEFGHLPDNITVLEGESVTLRCRIDEEVTHKAWLNRSNILFTGTDKWSLDKRVTLVNTSNREFSILIDKVQVADEGPYTCTFQANNKPRITHVYLIVQVPARIVNISKSVSLNEGESVTLYCLAVGRPEPTVTWRNQKCKIFILVFLPVENDNTLRIKNEKTRSLLLFTNVTEKHFGNYTCFASNRLGSSNASMLLFRPGALQGRGAALQAGMSASLCVWVSLSALLLVKV